jgi:hypothetical protein
MEYAERRMSMRSDNARLSADPDGVSAQMGPISLPRLMIGDLQAIARFILRRRFRVP